MPVRVADRPVGPLIEAVRTRPWDEAAIEALANWYADVDPPRSELVRLQAQLSRVAWDNPERARFQTPVSQLLRQHRERWVQPVANAGVSPNQVTFQCGLIDGLRADGTTDEQMAVIAGVTELRSLYLHSPKVTLKGFEEILRLPHLDSFSVDEMTLTAEHLAILEKLPPWTSLDVPSDVDKQAVAQMNEKRIAQFDRLSNEQRDSAGVRFLLNFAGGTQFGRRPTKANLSQSSITDTQMRFLSPLTDLEEIDISESPVTEKGIAHLAGMKELRRLALYDTMVATIEPLAGLTSLESLELYPDFDVKMGDAGVAALENFSELNHLFLRGEGFADGTVRRLSSLKKLRSLDLSLERLDDPSSLSALAGLSALRELTLEAPKIPEAALQHLAGLSHLERISMRVTKGKGDGLRHLAGLGNLRFLFLSGTGVTDSGILKLSKAKQLEVFMAQGSAVTPQGAKKLADSLPKVTIILGDTVIKSPRKSYTLRRQHLGMDASLLLPDDWFEKQVGENVGLYAREDGWKHIPSWGGEGVGPAEIRLHIDRVSKSSEDAMMASVNNNSHLKPKILERDVVKIPALKDFVSCIYRNNFEKYLLLAARCPDGFAVVSCGTKPARFDEFVPLFNAVARSVRVGPDPEVAKEESVELPKTTK
jgi:Leucine-rich repeat (LRR) protein